MVGLIEEIVEKMEEYGWIEMIDDFGGGRGVIDGDCSCSGENDFIARVVYLSNK